MTFPLLYIRLRQLQKEANALGLYSGLLAAIFILIVVACFKQFQKGVNAWYVVAALFILCAYIQTMRKDRSFVFTHIHHPHLQIFSEYLALTLPFSISAIVTKSWYCYPVLALLLSGIPFLRFDNQQKTIFKNLSYLIPASNFEWISGYRKNYILFSSLYLLALSFCWLRIFPLFLLWFLTVVIMSFHGECEGVDILRAGDKLPHTFLSGKLKINALYLAILYAPVLIINTIFNPEFLLVNGLFLPVQIALISFAICARYAGYMPNKNQTAGNIMFTIISLASAIPYSLPLPAFLTLVYFQRARKRLNLYLR